VNSNKKVQTEKWGVKINCWAKGPTLLNLPNSQFHSLLFSACVSFY